MQLNNKRTNNPIQKLVADLNRLFYNDIHMAKNHICSTILIIGERQIKTAMRYHFALVRMTIIKKSTSNKCWRDCGEKGTLLQCWCECLNKLVQPL